MLSDPSTSGSLVARGSSVASAVAAVASAVQVGGGPLTPAGVRVVVRGTGAGGGAAAARVSVIAGDGVSGGRAVGV